MSVEEEYERNYAAARKEHEDARLSLDYLRNNAAEKGIPDTVLGHLIARTEKELADAEARIRSTSIENGHVCFMCGDVRTGADPFTSIATDVADCDGIRACQRCAKLDHAILRECGRRVRLLRELSGDIFFAMVPGGRKWIRILDGTAKQPSRIALTIDKSLASVFTRILCDAHIPEMSKAVGATLVKDDYGVR